MNILKVLLRKVICYAIDNQNNPYHPFVWINGTPKIGKGTYIGGFGEVYAKGATVEIGDNCDIASFVVINCADSSRHCRDKSQPIEKLPIKIGNNVFIGTMSAILGGTTIGDNSVIGAGVILKNVTIPPNTLVKRLSNGSLALKELN